MASRRGLGARAGAVEAAKQNTFAASLTHNAAIQSVVLAAEAAYFDYMATRALLTAQQAVVQEATASVTAAVVTIATGSLKWKSAAPFSSPRAISLNDR